MLFVLSKLDVTIYFPFGRQHDKIHWQNSLYIKKFIYNNVIALWVLGGRGLIMGSFAITPYVSLKSTTVQFYRVLTCFIINFFQYTLFWWLKPFRLPFLICWMVSVMCYSLISTTLLVVEGFVPTTLYYPKRVFLISNIFRLKRK